jgi:hypothetical protein
MVVEVVGSVGGLLGRWAVLRWWANIARTWNEFIVVDRSRK